MHSSNNHSIQPLEGEGNQQDTVDMAMFRSFIYKSKQQAQRVSRATVC